MYRLLFITVLLLSASAQDANNCGQTELLKADAETKQFDIGNGKAEVDEHYTCEWKIQPIEGKAGEIALTVNKLPDVQADKQCIGVTTIAPGTQERKPTKVCAQEPSMSHSEKNSPVYVLYPGLQPAERIKSFQVSYQLTKIQLTGQCGEQKVLLAKNQKSSFPIGDGTHDLGADYKCEWQVKPEDGQTGDIEISLTKSETAEAATQCVDVTIEPPAGSSTNGAQRKTTKLCAGGETTTFRTNASAAFVLYPASDNMKVNKAFQFYYGLTNEPLTGQCTKPDVLFADKEQKMFPVGNGKHDLATDFKCEWQIQAMEGKNGTIEISVNKSTNGDASNECVDVTTVAATSGATNGGAAGAVSRNLTKVCADGSGSPFTTTMPMVYVVYPATGNTKSNKPFQVSYKLNSSVQLRSCIMYYLLLSFVILIFRS